MAALAASPERPIPRQTVKITFTGLASGTNQVRVFAVAAPEGSEVRQQMDRATADRPRLHEGPVDVPWDFTPDRGGVYRFLVEELQVQSASRAMFQGDPAGAPQTEILATSTVVLRVGQRLQLPLGVSPNTAQLRVFVWGDTIRPTTVAVHGEATPAVVSPTTLTATNAASATDVLTAVAALANETADDVIGNPASVFSSLRTAYAAHIANATPHAAADTHNTIGAGYAASNPSALIRAINRLRQQLRGHQDNLVDRSDPESTPTAPHTSPDGINQYLTAGAADAASAIPALVDAWMVYEAHRVTLSSVHSSADTTNTGPALSPLMTVHRRFFEALTATTPTVPPSINEGVSTLAQLGGFVEA
jgi:hypothetical protein